MKSLLPVLSRAVRAARYSINMHEQAENILKMIGSQICLGGPISVAQYMQIVLTNSHSGYYMKKDVFGKSGDFITSPEISQMFAVFMKMIAIWCINEWMRIGNPKKFQIIELGPGRGTLADDLLRSFSKFPIIDAITFNLVEISPTLEKLQRNKLGVDATNAVSSKYKVAINWYKTLGEIPTGIPTFIYANEFFDAMPIHKFQKIGDKWREIFIDYHENKLKFVLLSSNTLASSFFKKYLIDCHSDHLELSPNSLLLVEEISNRIKQDGGFALIVDYGHSGEKGDTFRGFKNHALHDPLIDPGTADLTADVNFKQLTNIALQNVSVFGPVHQSDFLKALGIDIRLKILLSKSTENESNNLISGYKMLMNEMGMKFKFMALLQKQNLGGYIPPGF